MSEIWKPIKNYEGLYEISNFGRVRSLTRYKKILKPCPNERGYLMVDLSKEGKRRKYFIHILVANAFLSNPNNLPQVNHKNEIKTDNNADNLEFCTNNYNLNYGSRNKRIRDKIAKKVVQYSMQEKILNVYESMTEASKKTGVTVQRICDCCKGRIKTSGGYKWRYANKENV